MDHGNKFGQLILNLPDKQKNIARYMWSIFLDATGFRISDFSEIPLAVDSSGLFPITSSFDDYISGNINAVASRYNLPEGLQDFRRHEPLACAFYLINSLHETFLSSDKLDTYGRYPYQESLQFSNDLIEVNYVQEIFDELYRKITNKPPVKKKSKLFWSHDIDYLYSAWKTDLIIAVREHLYPKIPAMLWNSLTKPHRWNNVDHILKLEKSYDVQSVFFWLTEQGKIHLSDNIYIDHADYSFRMKSLRELWNNVKKAGSRNGLHKSAFDHSFHQELQKLPDKVFINRNHFLKIQLPDHYDRIERCGLKYDATLGFPEHHGFRNSYGRPFQPYNLKENRPYRFTEFPLHLMDTTFRTYLNMDIQVMTNKMIKFIDQHRSSCIISILLHNSQYNFQNENEMKIWKRFYSELHGEECYIPEGI